MTWHYSSKEDWMKNNAFKTVLCGGLFLLAANALPAQTLFTIGDTRVSTHEFLQAFDKLQTQQPRAAAMEDYLPLYMNYRLKLKEAQALKMDTLPNHLQESQNLREQMGIHYLAQKRFLEEAALALVERSRKDVSFDYIAIPYPKNDAASLAKATVLATEIRKAWQNGTSVDQLLREHANPFNAGSSFGGNGGWINHFILPAAFEEAVYALDLQEISMPLAGSSDVYLFKKTGERPTVGKRVVSQILLSMPANSTPAVVERVSRMADSLYQLAISGTDFGWLADNFSTDRSTRGRGGVLNPVTPGQYDAAFEQQVYSLQNPGDVSRPFRGEYGMHILKLQEVLPLYPDNTDTAVAMAINDLRQSGREREIYKKGMQNLMQDWGFRTFETDRNQLFGYVDSLLHFRNPAPGSAIDSASPLFAFKDTIITANDWVMHLQRTESQGFHASPETAFEDFKIRAAEMYFRDNLEKLEPGFADQLKDFNESNLVFEISNNQVWKKAGADNEAIENYYNAHSGKYTWDDGAEVLFAIAQDSITLLNFRNALLGNPARWPEFGESNAGQVFLDSTRAEWSQIADARFPEGRVAGKASQVQRGAYEGDYSFVYIFKPVAGGDPKTFQQAYPAASADYQQKIENEWLETLRQKHPIKLKNSAWKKLLREAERPS